MTLRTDRALALLTLVTLLAYLAAFTRVPLFYDEVAFRMETGRAFIDGFAKHSFFPQCTGGRITTLLFLPAHAFFSWIDSWPNWLGVRALPILSLTLLLTAAGFSIAGQRGNDETRGVAGLLLCGAFVGVAGLGLVLSRPEYVTLLQATMCLVTWHVARDHERRHSLLIVVLVLHLIAIDLSLFAHPQGLLLMPVSFLVCMQLLREHRRWAALLAVLMVVMSFQSWQHFSVACPQDPVLEAALKTHQGSGIARNESADWPTRMMKRAARYERQFFFRDDPDAFSLPLPPVSSPTARLLNIPIAAVITLNLLALLIGAFVTLRVLAYDYLIYAKKRDVRALLNALLLDGRLVWLGAASLVLFFSAYEVSGTFYRADFRNLVTVVLLAIGAAHLDGKLGKKFITTLAVLAFLTCFASGLVARTMIAPQLKQGYEGIGVSLQRDWTSYNENVRAQAQRCGIPNPSTRIIIDDSTYAALRQHTHPIGYNYLWFDEILKQGSLQKKDPKERQRRLQSLGSPGYVVRCDAIDRFGLTPRYRDHGICCSGLIKQKPLAHR